MNSGSPHPAMWEDSLHACGLRPAPDAFDVEHVRPVLMGAWNTGHQGGMGVGPVLQSQIARKITPPGDEIIKRDLP